MKLENILTDWKSDSQISDADLLKELFRTPHLHSKYLEFYVLYKAKLSQTERKINSTKWLKRRYWRGEFTKDELTVHGWDQWQGLKPNGTELNQLYETDSDLIDLTEHLSYNKTAVTAIEYILKQIQSRDWAIKSAIEYQKYLSGS